MDFIINISTNEHEHGFFKHENLTRKFANTRSNTERVIGESHQKPIFNRDQGPITRQTFID